MLTGPTLAPEPQAREKPIWTRPFAEDILSGDFASWPVGENMAPGKPPRKVTFCVRLAFVVIPIVICVLLNVDFKVPELGAASLGVLIGMMIGFFVQETEKWDKRALTSAVLVMTGGGVSGFMHWASPVGGHEIWFYPIGLLVGLGLGTIWEVIDP
jgi:hypothetical protein